MSNCPDSIVVVHIVHKGTGLAIDLNDDNKHLELKPLASCESQHWVAHKTEWGSYIFINRKSGKALDCKKHAKTEPINHSNSQEWYCNCDGVLKNAKRDVVLSVKRKTVFLGSLKNTMNEQFCLQICDKEVSYERS